MAVQEVSESLILMRNKRRGTRGLGMKRSRSSAKGAERYTGDPKDLSPELYYKYLGEDGNRGRWQADRLLQKLDGGKSIDSIASISAEFVNRKVGGSKAARARSAEGCNFSNDISLANTLADGGGSSQKK